MSSGAKGVSAIKVTVKPLVSLFYYFTTLTALPHAQINTHADCTTLVKHGDASISVCGGVDDDKSASLCSDLAGFANQIQQTCMSGASGSAETFAGGTYTISPSKRVEVINSGGKIVE